MQSMAPFRGLNGRHLEVFDPFSLYFWDDFPCDFPFRAPFMMPPPPPRLLSNMEPYNRSKIEHKVTPDTHRFIAELPGVKKEDVKVRVDDARVLHISAQSKHDKEEKDNYHQIERGFGQFVSRFMLPRDSKPEHPRCCVENGMLTVSVPKEKVDRVDNQHHQYVECPEESSPLGIAAPFHLGDVGLNPCLSKFFSEILLGSFRLRALGIPLPLFLGF